MGVISYLRAKLVVEHGLGIGGELVVAQEIVIFGNRVKHPFSPRVLTRGQP
jgi:hypothetical protein